MELNAQFARHGDWIKRSQARLVISLLMLFIAPIEASPYRFSSLVRSGDTLDGITLLDFGSFSLNNALHVGFYGTYGTQRGIFTDNNGLEVSVGTEIGGVKIDALGSGLFLNDSGTLAFNAMFGDYSGIFTQSSVLAKQPDTTISGMRLTWIGQIYSFNNAGTAAFTAKYTVNGNPSGGMGVFSQSANLVKRGDTISGLTLITAEGGPTLNDQGVLAFAGDYAPCCDSSRGAIFTPNTVVAKTGDVIGGKTLIDSFVGVAGINSNGVILFSARYTEPSGNSATGIFTQNEFVAATGSVVAGKTLLGTRSARINDLGTIFYTASFSGGVGLFTADDLLVQTGDIIDGRTLTGISSSFSANQTGSFAFIGTFSDGSKAMVLAQPVPEPSAYLTAYSGEADQDSGLMAIRIPGPRNQPSERSDAGLLHDQRVIGISQPF